MYALAAVALTWPLAQFVATRLPLGRETSATVPLFNLWTRQWNARELAAGFRGYWDAPIFYPTAGAFALTEPQPLTGAIFAAVMAWAGSAPLAHNLVLLLYLALNGHAQPRPALGASHPDAGQRHAATQPPRRRGLSCRQPRRVGSRNQSPRLAQAWKPAAVLRLRSVPTPVRLRAT